MFRGTKNQISWVRNWGELIRESIWNKWFNKELNKCNQKRNETNDLKWTDQRNKWSNVLKQRIEMNWYRVHETWNRVQDHIGVQRNEMNHMIQYELEWTDQKQRNKWSHNETGQLCPETKWTETKYKLRETWNRVQKQICVQRNKCSIWIEKQCSNKDHETKSFRSTVYEIKSKWSSEAETKLEQMILLWTETDWIRNSSGSNVARSETWSTS